jgi:periplasmic protein TonB
MPKSLRSQELIAAEPPERPPIQSVKKQKLQVLLVTEDETLWPQIGADLSGGLVLKQLDNIEELINSTPSGQAAIVLWDARNHPDPASVLSSLQLHSARFAIIALDNQLSAGAWTLPIQNRQVVAHVGLPIAGTVLSSALDNAHEEVNSRLALMGDGSEPAPAVVAGAPRKPWLIPAVGGGVALIALVAFLLLRQGSSENKPVATAGTAAKTSQTPQPAVAKPALDADEKVDALIEKAQQAMLDRHYIDPVAGSALSLYREVLIINPDNGEARQGLERLSEILIARVQSALDDHKFDQALQSLETARSIDASDRRLSALDEKIASMRAELGPAQILAAINAQNFDRAVQLIDEAARAKSLPAAKLTQLRDEVHRRRDEFDVTRLLKMFDARLQQDHLIEPRNDSAAYYLEQARQAGAPAADLQTAMQELLKHIGQLAHNDIDQRRFTDVDRLLAEMKILSAPAASITALQHDLSVARSQQAAQKLDQPQYLELAQSRLAQGKLTEPDGDSALYYLNQLRASDPKNAGLPQLAGAVQAQILDRARTSLDAGDIEKSEALAQLAAGIGGSSDLDAFNERLRQRKPAAGELAQLPEQSLKRLNKLDVQYPDRALQLGTEGWVEIGYTVGADGSVSNVKVLNAVPPKTFDASATHAVSRLRYQPVLQNGKASPVSTQVRIVYRVPK